MVKQTQTSAHEFFECVWPFREIGQIRQVLMVLKMFLEILLAPIIVHSKR